MRLRTFTAATMPDAMKMVRDALGEEAIILSSQTGNSGVKITAAISADDEDSPPPHQKTATGQRGQNIKDSGTLRLEIQNILRFHNVPEPFASRILQKANDTLLAASIALHRIGGHKDETQLHRQTLEKILSSYFVFEPLAFTPGNKPLMLVGPPGIGKTLTIAKIAAKLALSSKPLSVITTDNKRAGGIEQLQAFTDILGVKLQTATNADELYDSLQAAPKQSRILIDTAGCNPYDPQQISELESYTAIDYLEPVLVLPAGGDSQESVDMVEQFAELPIKKLMVTRADTARRFGGILAAAASQGLAFCNTSSSPGVSDSLEPMDAAKLAEILLRYQSKAEHHHMKTGNYDR